MCHDIANISVIRSTFFNYPLQSSVPFFFARLHIKEENEVLNDDEFLYPTLIWSSVYIFIITPVSLLQVGAIADRRE